MRSFEEILAFHCAPALAGIKPACLISCKISDDGDPFFKQLTYLNHSLNRKQIHIRPVQQKESRVLLLVYRHQKLHQHLSFPAQQIFLGEMGYPLATLEEQLTYLEKRLDSKEFPHEMGVFLGYPIQDIKGFVKNNGKNFKLSGYWKVYTDEETARATFARYNKCREALCRRISTGKTIEELFCAA